MDKAQKIDIYSPRFVGSRFDDHTLPLELLDDISALEDLTIELAKIIYLEENPERKRVPRGFTDGMDIKLESIESGSTKLKIVLLVVSANLFPPDNAEYFTKASKKLVDAIQAAENKEDATLHVPEKILKYFNKIGKKLHPDESIEFKPEEINKARLTKQSRKRLLLAASSNKEYTDEVELRGLVSEMDKSRNTFQLLLTNGQKITGNFSGESIDNIQSAFTGYEDKRLILIKGIGQFNNVDRLQNIESVESSELLDEFDVPARIEEIALLKDGWLNGEGIAPSPNSLSWFSYAFEQNFSPHLPLPAIYPTPDGQIQAEWNYFDIDASLLIDLDKKTSILNVLKLVTEDELEATYDLSTDSGWSDLNSELKKHFTE